MSSLRKQIPKCFHSELAYIALFASQPSTESIIFLLKDGTFYEYESFTLLRSIDLKDYLAGKELPLLEIVDEPTNNSEYNSMPIENMTPGSILCGKYIYRYGSTRTVFILVKVEDQLIILERNENGFKVFKDFSNVVKFEVIDPHRLYQAELHIHFVGGGESFKVSFNDNHESKSDRFNFGAYRDFENNKNIEALMNDVQQKRTERTKKVATNQKLFLDAKNLRSFGCNFIRSHLSEEKQIISRCSDIWMKVHNDYLIIGVPLTNNCSERLLTLQNIRPILQNSKEHEIEYDYKLFQLYDNTEISKLDDITSYPNIIPAVEDNSIDTDDSVAVARNLPGTSAAAGYAAVAGTSGAADDLDRSDDWVSSDDFDSSGDSHSLEDLAVGGHSATVDVVDWVPNELRILRPESLGVLLISLALKEFYAANIPEINLHIAYDIYYESSVLEQQVFIKKLLIDRDMFYASRFQLTQNINSAKNFLSIAQASLHKAFDVSTNVKNTFLRDLYKILVQKLQFNATTEYIDKSGMIVDRNEKINPVIFLKLNKNGGNYWYGTIVKISEGFNNNIRMEIFAEFNSKILALVDILYQNSDEIFNIVAIKRKATNDFQQALREEVDVGDKVTKDLCDDQVSVSVENVHDCRKKIFEKEKETDLAAVGSHET